MGLRIYFDTLSHSDPNQSEEVNTLRANNTNLSLENANLTRDNKNLTDQLGNLTQAYNVSERNVKDLSAGVQELETKKNNLTQQIQNMETNRNELDISRAQWSIESYCLGNTDKKCKPCQKGWSLTQPSCYAYNNAQPPIKKTWEEAQEDCRGNNSDLAVARSNQGQSFGPNGFWIGLRVEDGKWKWVDGSDLTESWISVPDPVDGRCAWFYKDQKGWYSVSCEEKHQWICQKKALSV
ncbi:hypothetical protein KUCAC02_032290 [Chaenocephalus aceratus]|nr:hypothetical protein KUCAC02_032290 [Chaenocephalus aceratus]